MITISQMLPMKPIPDLPIMTYVAKDDDDFNRYLDQQLSDYTSGNIKLPDTSIDHIQDDILFRCTLIQFHDRGNGNPNFCLQWFWNSEIMSYSDYCKQIIKHSFKLQNIISQIIVKHIPEAKNLRCRNINTAMK